MIEENNQEASALAAAIEKIEKLKDDAAEHAIRLERSRDYDARDNLRSQVNAYVKVLALLAGVSADTPEQK